MIKARKRLLYLLLMFAIGLLALPVGAASTYAAVDEDLPTGGVIKPVYEVQKAKEPQKKRLLKSKGANGGVINDTEAEAGRALAFGMKRRDANVTVFTAYMMDAKIVYKNALEHTKYPNEGDYLRWHNIGFSCHFSSSRLDYNFNEDEQYYHTTREQEEYINNEVPRILNDIGIASKTTDYEKVKAIYDWICDNVTYDYDNLEDKSYKLKYSAYAALHNKKAVCQGYANLLYRMMLEAGVDCRIITGTGNGGDHAWNIVKLGDKWYNLDATWDAPRNNNEYFLKSNENFKKHTRDEEFATSDFNAAFPMSTSDYSPSGSNGLCYHNYALVENKSATCVEDGHKKYECTKCDNIYYTNLSFATGVHDYSKHKYIDSSQHAIACVHCDKEIARTSHDWDSGVVTREPTNIREGVRTYTCTSCNGTKIEAIPRLMNYTNISFGTSPYFNSMFLSVENKDGDSISDTPAHGYKYTGVKNETINIEVEDQGVDTIIYLLNEDGEQIRSVDSRGSNGTEQTEYTFPEDGTLYMQVAAYYDNGNGTYTIRVKRPLQSISLGKNSVTLGNNDTEILSVSYFPENTTDSKSVTWRSSDTSVAMVSNTGEVRAISNGIATITATAAGKSAICTVEVKGLTYPKNINFGRIKYSDIQYLSSYETDNDGLGLGKRPARGYTYNGREGETIIIDVMSDDFDAYLNLIDENGDIVGYNDDDGDGTNARITYTFEKDETIRIQACGYYQTDKGDIKVEVRRPLTGISFEKREITMSPDDTMNLEVIYNPDNTTDDMTVIWNSSDSSVATVSGNGKVTALKGGYATITARVGDNQSSVDVVVKHISYPNAISFDKTKYTHSQTLSSHENDGVGEENKKARGYYYVVSKGEMIQVDLISNDFDSFLYFLDSNGRRFAFNDDDGGDGNARIIFEFDDEEVVYIQVAGYNKEPSGSYTLEVSRLLQSISLNVNNVETYEGASINLYTISNPINATEEYDVQWISSDTRVATVDGNGKVTAKAAGTAIITATALENSAKCTITVKAEDKPQPTPSTGGTSNNNGGGKTGNTGGATGGGTPNNNGGSPATGGNNGGGTPSNNGGTPATGGNNGGGTPSNNGGTPSNGGGTPNNTGGNNGGGTPNNTGGTPATGGNNGGGTPNNTGGTPNNGSTPTTGGNTAVTPTTGGQTNNVSSITDKPKPVKITPTILNNIPVNKKTPVINANKIKTIGYTSKKKVVIKFPKVKNAKNYIIAFKRGGDKKWSYYTTGKKTSYTINKLKLKSLLQFKVASYDGKARSKWSNTSYRYLAVVKGTVKAGKKKITIKFKPLKGATSYRIFYSTKKNMKGQKSITVSAKKKSVTIKKLKSGKKYYVMFRPLKKSKGKLYHGVLAKKRVVRVK